MWIKKERFRWNKQIVPAKTLPFSFYFLISGSAGVRDKPSRRYMLMEGVERRRHLERVLCALTCPLRRSPSESVPEINIYLRRTPISHPPDSKSDLQRVAASDISRFIRSCDDSLAPDESCMFVHHKILCVHSFSDRNICGDYTVLYDSPFFNDTSSSDNGILNRAFDQAAVGDNG